jgi:hypothetical protein
MEAAQMTHLPHIHNQSPRRTSGRLPRFAASAAWFFIGFSLLQLVWVLLASITGGPAADGFYASAFTQAGVGGFGLAYVGAFGFILALIELALIGAAAWCTFRPDSKHLRLGHALLIGWAGLWVFGMTRLMFADPGFDSVCRALLMTGLLGCTIWRARMAPAVPRAKSLASSHITTSAAVREIQVQCTVEDADDLDTPPAAKHGRFKRSLCGAGRAGTSVCGGAHRAAKKAWPVMCKGARGCGRAARAGHRSLKRAVAQNPQETRPA